MVIYYVMLILGSLFVIGAVVAFCLMVSDKNYPLLTVGKSLLSLLLGLLILWITLPSLKYVVYKEYDIVSGGCVIEIDSANRSRTADFRMVDTDEIFSFRDFPELEAYGRAIPYYCELTVTKDHMFEVGYKIFDHKTRKLIVQSENE